MNKNLPSLNRLLALLVLPLILLPASTAWPSQRPPAPQTKQELIVRVLDKRDRPVAGAEVIFQALAGGPESPGPFRTGPGGELHLTWAPKVTYISEQQGISDHVFTLVSRLNYTVEAKGFFPARGRLEQSGRSRIMASPELRGLDKKAVLPLLVKVVILGRPSDVLTGGLEKRPLSDPLVKKLLHFRQEMIPVARHLGVEFASPAFGLKDKELTISLDWQGTAWAGLALAPLKARIIASAGLPFALACGEDLLPLPGVDRVGIEVISMVPPKDDPYGAPTKAAIKFYAPSGAIQDLAMGLMTPEEILQGNPPYMDLGRFPAARPDLARWQKEEELAKTKQAEANPPVKVKGGKE